MRRSSSVTLITLSLTITLVPGKPAARDQDTSRQLYAPRNSVIRLDAIVTDAQGRPIANLRREDFELVDNGAIQPIETLEFRTGHGPAPRAAATVRSPLDTADSVPASGRLLALFLDEYHVSAANTERVRDALRRFLDDQLHPDDLVAVMKPLDSVVSIRVTRNHDEVRAAIDGFTGCKGEYEPRSPFEASVISRAPEAAEAARAQVVMSALQALAIRLGGQREGRKAIVFVSEGFSATEPRNRIRLPDVQSLVRAAQRFDVAIYAFSPVLDAAPPAATNEGDATLLRAVADPTSGEALLRGGELDAGLRRVTRDLDAYYTLTFKPSSPSDGRFHPIELRVKRKGAHVRARSGYWTTSLDELRRARLLLTPTTPAFRPKPQKISPLVQPWIRMTRAPDGRTRVQFMWEPKAAPAGARAKAQPPLGTLVLSATAADGRSIFTGRVSPARGGIDRTAPTQAIVDAQPGPLALEMSIEDINENVLDTDARTITVPDLNGARTVLGTPEVLRTRTAVEFRAAAVDLEAVPTAARVFSRSERLLIRAPAFGPAGAAASVTARLLNAIGQPIHDLPAVGPASADGIAQFDLLLSSFPPGEYRIELTATSGDTDAKEAFGFRVIG